MRARATNVPLTIAQATASPIRTLGSAGFSGGCLPVAARQPELRAFFATAAAPRAETSEKTVHSLLDPPSAMPEAYPAEGPGSCPPAGEAEPREMPCRATVRAAGSRLFRSQYGVGSAGSASCTLTAFLR